MADEPKKDGLKTSDRFFLSVATVVIGILVAALVIWGAYSLITKVFAQDIKTNTSAGSTLPIAVMQSSSTGSTALHKKLDPSSVPGYFRVVGSCNWEFKEAKCVTPRTGPGTSYKEASITGIPFGSPYKLRNDQMLYGTGSFVDAEGETWAQIDPKMTPLVYPGRIKDRYWYISADYLVSEPINESTNGSGKTIRVNVTQQVGYAMSGSILIKSFFVSTGRIGLETPVGTFATFEKYPLKSMEAPLFAGEGGEQYTLFSPFSMAFARKNAKIYLHAEYWHNRLGHQMSHGCINLSFDDAKWLYEWAPLGTPVIVKY